LSKAADALIAALVGRVTEAALLRLREDAPRRALERAFGAALQRYAGTATRLELARPLLQPDGLLADPVVAMEISPDYPFRT
jgi:hypothetical protein